MVSPRVPSFPQPTLSSTHPKTPCPLPHPPSIHRRLGTSTSAASSAASSMSGGTVYALSSGVGRAGVAIIRISGGEAHSAALALLRGSVTRGPDDRGPGTSVSTAHARDVPGTSSISSGPAGLEHHHLEKPGAAALPKERYAATRTLKDPRDGSILDRALVLRFDGPASFTGEVRTVERQI
jgi:tRNA modification GTPase